MKFVWNQPSVSMVQVLLDAIDQDDMKKVYQDEAKYVDLNPGMWDKTANDWASTAWYTLADGTKMSKEIYLCYDPCFLTGWSRCQCHLEHNQCNPFRPSLPLHHSSLG